MTPFDPVALRVMLETFYPLVTRASLERAFRERPEYFAGGTLIGRLGEVLQLQDGRLFDLAFSAWTAVSRWQALDVTHSEGGAGDPFGLEEGPLVPIDIDGIPPPLAARDFEQLAGEMLGDLGASHVVLETAGRELARTDETDTLDAAYDDAIAPAWSSISGRIHAVEALNASGLVENAEGLDGTTDDRAADYPDESNTPDAAPDVDPGPPPRDDREERPDRGDEAA